MATITPANLSYKDKDGDLGEVKSLTDTDVTLLNSALQDIEDLKLAYSPGFVKRDFSNVTQDGKNTAVGWGMPDLESGISIYSQLPYTATADGYIRIQVTTGGGSSSGYFYGEITKNSVSTFIAISVSSGHQCAYFYPIPKGAVLARSNSGGTIIVSFYPVQGEV